MRVVRLLPLAGLFLAFAGSGAATATEVAPSFDNVTMIGKAPRVRATPTAATATWCGGGQESATNRTPEVELSAPEQVHVVYAIPSDGADAFGTYASPIASDAEAIDAWWRGQDPSRTPRFDLYSFPGCVSRFGMLDISVVRLPQSSAYYGVDIGTRMQRLTTDLLNRFGPRMKMLVYYDGSVPEPNICGTAWNGPPDGDDGSFGFAYIWLRSQCPNDVGAGALSAHVAAHEFTHNLGALYQAPAPNGCPGDPGHVCDNALDILYPVATVNTRLSTDILDFGRNDYYGHSSPWTDTQDSAWLSHLPQFLLTIATRSTNGKATGTVQPCSGCTLQLDNGLQVALRASPAAGSRLVGWQGACSGAGACSLTMDGPKSVTAIFGPAVFTLSVSVAGKGRVTSTPAGLSCSKRCSHRFEVGQKVRLKVKPAKGFRFTGWSGSCRGKSACTLAADRNRSARATFNRTKRR